MAEQPRVLLCCFDVVPAPTGASRRVTEYLRTIGDKFDVVALTLRATDAPHIERYMGARLLRVPVTGKGLPAQVRSFDRAVRRQLESEEYALVHFFDPFGGFALCELRENYGYKVIYDATTFPSVEMQFVEAIAKNQPFLDELSKAELVCLMNVEGIITGSGVTKHFITSRGVDEPLVHVLRSPVDRAPYTQESVGIPDASPMKIVYIGNGRGHQGLSTVLKALQIALRVVDVRLSLVGPVAHDVRSALEAQVRELKLTGKLEVLPPAKHDELVRVIANADVGLISLDDVPRNREQGEPLTRLSEYLAAGRPVIATDLPVTRELIPAEVGLFYPPGDAQALASHWVHLANDVAARLERGAKARAASACVDTHTIGEQLLALYADIGLLPQPTAASGDAPVTSPSQKRARLARPAQNRIVAGDFLSNDVQTGTHDITDLIEAPPSGFHTAPTPPPEPVAPATPPLPVSPTPVPEVEAIALDDDEPEEVGDEEFEHAPDEEEVSVTAPPLAPAPSAPRPNRPPPLPTLVGPPADESEESPSIIARKTDEIPGLAVKPRPTEELPAINLAAADNGVDQWANLILQGYCPPETTTFNRPPPPTNFPGRDNPPR